MNVDDPRRRDAIDFIERCRARGHDLIMSTLLFEEGLYRDTEKLVRKLLVAYNFIVVNIDSRSYLARAVRWYIKRGYGLRRVFDVAHLMVAKDLGCRYIAAVDRFVKRHAREFKPNLCKLLYWCSITWCSTKSGENVEIKQVYS